MVWIAIAGIVILFFFVFPAVGIYSAIQAWKRFRTKEYGAAFVLVGLAIPALLISGMFWSTGIAPLVAGMLTMG